ncbi:MAG: hypothetical protein ACJAU6_001576 [Alphaproteobacteria bacterium]|jgi:hypothetical protein
MSDFTMRDPTAETSATQRDRIPPKADLSNATIGLLCISKERSEEFLDTVERQMTKRGLKILRFAKLTHTKPAPEAVLQDIIERCDVVVEGLAD